MGEHSEDAGRCTAFQLRDITANKKILGISGMKEKPLPWQSREVLISNRPPTTNYASHVVIDTWKDTVRKPTQLAARS